MPIPWLVIGAVALASGFKKVGDSVTKDNNEEAERIVDRAQERYDDAKRSLERAAEERKQAYEKLGEAKRDCITGPMEQFTQALDRMGAGDMPEFHIDFSAEDIVQMQELNKRFAPTVSGGIGAGAAAGASGALIALAANGALPFIISDLSLAGGALLSGAPGVAATVLGGAAGFGAAMTPPAAVVAPALIVSSIAAGVKSEENLDKAREFRAEADAKTEQIKTQVSTLNGLKKQSEMFLSMLQELNKMFVPLARQCDRIAYKMPFEYKGVNKEDLFDVWNSEHPEEVNLVAVTSSIAGAIKCILETPLEEDGMASPKAKEAAKIEGEIPEHKNQADAALRAVNESS